MNRYHLVPTTEFAYDSPVSESYNEVRLRPMDDDRQSCVSFKLMTTPGSGGTAYRDSLGNWVHQFNVFPEHRRLRIDAESVVLAHETPPQPADDLTLTEFTSLRDSLHEEYFDFLSPSAYVPLLPQIEDFADLVEGASGDTVGGFARCASDFIHERFRYVKGATHVHSSIQDSLSINAGVCQDFAHLLLGILRVRGIPARYVSGYLAPQTERANTLRTTSTEEVIGGQASHAWAEAYLPNAGWTGLDPTLGTPVTLRHVRIAYGRDYGDVAPVRGIYKGHSGQRLSVDVRVRPAVDDDGRELLISAPEPVGEAPPNSERPHQPAQQ
jgi:transglutaminase-like putative cysteine protease